MNTIDDPHLPGAHLDLAKVPGHWLLARMGKRVLRPGGLELTRRMLEALAIGSDDVVVELAPGLGATARLALERRPAAFVAVERDAAAAASVARILTDPRDRCLVGSAMETGLDAGAATVVYGEAMLSMQTAAQKSRIVREAFRVLQPGGRYAIHELGLTPNTLAENVKDDVMWELSAALCVGARPLTVSEWRAVLEAEGFEVQVEERAPMHLLEPRRLIRDEGIVGVLRILVNVLRSPMARERVRAMRASFRNHQDKLCAVTLVARKPTTHEVGARSDGAKPGG